MTSITVDDLILRTGQKGTDFNIIKALIGDSKSGYKNVVTFNIPLASSTSTGLLSSEDFIAFSSGSGSSNSYFPSGW